MKQRRMHLFDTVGYFKNKLIREMHQMQKSN